MDKEINRRRKEEGKKKKELQTCLRSLKKQRTVNTDKLIFITESPIE